MAGRLFAMAGGAGYSVASAGEKVERGFLGLSAALDDALEEAVLA